MKFLHIGDGNSEYRERLLPTIECAFQPCAFASFNSPRRADAEFLRLADYAALIMELPESLTSRSFEESDEKRFSDVCADFGLRVIVVCNPGQYDVAVKMFSAAPPHRALILEKTLVTPSIGSFASDILPRIEKLMEGWVEPVPERNGDAPLRLPVRRDTQRTLGRVGDRPSGVVLLFGPRS